MDNKIYLITRHAICNYGSLLQTMASQKLFNDLGYECIVIDYISKEESVLNNVKTFANNKNIKGFKKYVYYIIKYIEESFKTNKFNNQRKKYLELTKRFDNLNSMLNVYKENIICAGSDQLWGLMPNGKIDLAYFLAFADKSNKKISLSSSFGRYDLLNSDLENIKNELSSFEFISVREKSAQTFLQKNNIKSNLFLDPTLLIDSNYYFKFVTCPKIKYKYILIYKLRNDNELDKLAERISKKANLKIIYVTNSIFMNCKLGKNFANRSLNNVLGLFNAAEFVITDSFHATVLSIIFKKNFYTHLPGVTSTRIIDFLDELNLNDRYFKNNEEIIDVNQNIDYFEVDRILNIKRKNCIDILSNKLEEIKR